MNGAKIDLLYSYAVDKVHILLPKPDIYTLGRTGGQGKTYLCGLLQRLQETGRAIVSFRANSNTDVLKEIQTRMGASIDVIFIDRYDICASLTNNRVVDAISHTIPVVLDYKSAFYTESIGRYVPEALFYVKDGEYRIEYPIPIRR